nr:EOG090X0AVX [Lepidurus arcticus]
MAEEEAIFDPNLKKKKKKKKTPFDLDAALGETTTGDKEEETSKDAGAEQEEDKDKEDDTNLDLDTFGKKKKKKKKPFVMDDLEGALPAEADNKMLEDEEKDKEGIEDVDLDLDFSKKKKKKKKKDLEGLMAGEDKDDIENEMGPGATWAGSDRDYTYDELLNRVFNIMREKNPEMVAGEKKKFTMRPPQVVRIGTKKTSFANFTEICKMLHRQPKHLLAFLLAELGTSGSVDGNNQLIIKGRFQQKQMENVLRRYVKEYVTCHTCRSPETILQKDTRLFFLQCETCGSRCSVASIKSGFQAVTSKRAAIRAKTT